ncbi:hypothetical protein E2C01_037261 [Portunus trituberculatus]|uniref:Uncharacterized protein n=1 Tax=Portunus trituberculatus TaxID=210409 RepID=A0A5B7F8W6_PORTR|nr:hypothetical protein [Portunus trituberculatus]
MSSSALQNVRNPSGGGADCVTPLADVTEQWNRETKEIGISFRSLLLWKWITVRHCGDGCSIIISTGMVVMVVEVVGPMTPVQNHFYSSDCLFDHASLVSMHELLHLAITLTRAVFLSAN